MSRSLWMKADRWLLCASAALRACAVGLSGVILALHLAAIGFTVWSIGLVVSLGLTGCAIGTALSTLVADRLGRRATLVILALLMALGGLALALTSQAAVAMVGACVGMVNGMGRDRGAGVTVEQAILPQTTTDSQRTTVFAWYNLLVDAGHAVGALLGGLPAFLRTHAGMPALASYHWTWGCYSFLCLLAGGFALRLSQAVELRGPSPVRRLSPS